LRLTLIFGLVMLAGMASLPRAASAMPGSYARAHPDYCAQAWQQKSDARTYSGNRFYCAAHRNDDRISRIVCDPYVSKVDPVLPAVTISQAWLSAARNLTEAESRSECQPDGHQDRCGPKPARRTTGCCHRR
jgi:hypothetical protein